MVSDVSGKRRAGRLGTRDICYIAIFTAIIAVLSQLSIPMPAGVPMTLQTFIIPLAGVVLGTKRGTIATLVYVLLGAAGVPVFSGFSGGIGVVLGVTGGFIVSFPIMAAASGMGAAAFYGASGTDGGRAPAFRRYALLLSGLIAGALINYVVGMLWFSVAADTPIGRSFVLVVLPFLPTTVVKIALDAWIGPRLRSALERARVL